MRTTQGHSQIPGGRNRRPAPPIVANHSGLITRVSAPAPSSSSCPPSSGVAAPPELRRGPVPHGPKIPGDLDALEPRLRSAWRSCMGRRMAEGAALLVDHVLPAFGYRQWVLSFEGRVAVRLGYDQALLAAVAESLARAVMQGMGRSAKECHSVATVETLHDPVRASGLFAVEPRGSSCSRARVAAVLRRATVGGPPVARAVNGDLVSGGGGGRGGGGPAGPAGPAGGRGGDGEDYF